MVAGLAGGDVRMLARAVSLVEDGAGLELVAACKALGRRAKRIGVTGPPGAGKSTLVDQMVKWLREARLQVGVVAVDPSSPFTGGALLGDRIRMQGFAGDSGVYIRSMASRGAMGGLAKAVEDVCTVIEAAGKQTILIETVGVGQDEVEVVGLADVTVVVLVPGMGDEVQSLKAGLMETVRRCAGEKTERRVRLGAPTPVRFDGVPSGQLRSDGLRLDHLGVAVRSIAAARGFYEALGLVVTHEETVEHEQVKTAMLPLGSNRIELLEPTQADSTIGRFLAKRGEGLHHVAVHVEGVDAMFARLKAQGVRLASAAVRVGAGGHRYFFVHPESTGGVLLEIVGDGEGGH